MYGSILRKVAFAAIFIGLALSQSLSAHAAKYIVQGTGTAAGVITDVNTNAQSITVKTSDTNTSVTIYCIPFTNLVNRYNYMPAVKDIVSIAYEIRKLPDGTFKFAAISLTHDDLTYTFIRTK
jgi:hypothetical protein